MTSIVMILTVSLLCVFVIMAVSVWVMNWLLKLYIGSKHQLIEEILRTKEVPKRWSQKVHKNATGSAEAMRRYIKKLDRLMKYAQRTKLVADEETRQTLLAGLERFRKKWGEGCSNGQHTLREQKKTG